MDIATINQQISNEKINLNRVEAKISENNSEITKNENDIATNDNNVAANSVAQQETTSKISTLGGQISDVQTRKSGVQAEINQLKGVIESGSKDDADYSANQQKLQDLNMSMSDLDKMNEDFNKQKQEQEQLLKNQQSEGADLSQKSTDLQQRKEQLQATATDLNTQKADAEANIKFLEKEQEKAYKEASENNANEDLEKAKGTNKKEEQNYKGGLPIGEDGSLKFKANTLSYTDKNFKAYAGEKGFGMGYNTSGFSMQGGYDTSSGVHGGATYSSTNGKMNAFVSANKNGWAAGADYKLSNDLTVSAVGRGNGIEVGMKVNLGKRKHS